MNVFEDLIVELKAENLLESTISDGEKATAGTNAAAVLGPSDEAFPAATEPSVPLPVPPPTVKPVKRPSNGREFYKKRAVTEISNLQMVEHVLTSVEREYMKVAPKVFDDFGAKKALNAFLQVEEDENSEAHTAAEFVLLQETEAWCIALSERDRKVAVSSLRLYCENSSPPLSSQALLSIARFYRNLPYSETVRAKFDFVTTRLFSRPATDDRREILFSREEIVAHLNTLYSEWSSIAFYGGDEDEAQLMLTTLSFEDLAIEAENAGGFDSLVGSDYFGRLRQFKESVNEMFFAPSVTAAAIDTNVRVGNAYVSLIDRERRKMDADSIGSKYADLQDDSVSDATARTLDLVGLLRSRGEKIDAENASDVPEDETLMTELVDDGRGSQLTQPREKPTELERYDRQVIEDTTVDEKSTVPAGPFYSNLKEKALNVNRWFLAVSLLLIAGSVGLYLYSNYVVSEGLPSPAVKQAELDNSLKEHLKLGRISGEMFYGVLEPSWDALPKEKRTEFLLKVYAAGRAHGYTQVTLTGKGGRNVAYASATRTDVEMP
ncbi:MAG: hypothetical protein WKF34_10610 [Pyrinomonadaceae bacterium]